MAIKPTETGGSFNPSAAQAKRQQLLNARRDEVIKQSAAASASAAQTPSASQGSGTQETQITSQSIGTGYTNSAITQEKVLVMAAKDPKLGDYIGSLLLGNQQTVQSSSPSLPLSNVQNQSIDRYTKNVLQTIFSAEVATSSKQALQTDAKVSQATAGLSPATNEAEHDVNGIREDLAKILQPVSAFTGSTLGNLSNLLENPLGAPLALAGSLTNVVDRVNPDFMNRIDATFKQFKSSELAHLPGQIMGSIRSLATAADKLLAMPVNLLSDLYEGLMKIMQQISKLVDKVQTMIQSFFFGPQGILDQVLPMDLIKGIIDDVGQIGAIAGSISQMAGGFSAIQNITSQVTNFTSQGTAFLNNPMSLVESYVPQIGQINSVKGALASGNVSGVIQAVGVGGSVGGQVDMAMSALRDPTQLLSKLVPSSLLSQMGQIGQIPGLGAVGNLGFGLGPILNSLKPTAISQTLANFPQQIGILAPFLNMAGPPPIHEPATPQEVSIQTASTNPNVPVVQGVPIQTTPAAPIFEQAKNQERMFGNDGFNELIPPDPGPFKLQQSNRGPTKEAAAQLSNKPAPLVMVPSAPLD